MSRIVKCLYQNVEVSFTEDGWIDATAIADAFGKRPGDWLKLPGTEEYILALMDELKIREKISLIRTRRKSGTWLHTDLAVPFARWLDVRFAIWCDQQIKALLKGSHPHYDWKRLRHEASSSFKVMNAVLQLQRQMQGKESKVHHFTNEARLVNWALKGEFKSVNREGLSNDELDLLAKLEERNAVLIGLGFGYDDRKTAMKRFVADRMLLA